MCLLSKTLLMLLMLHVVQLSIRLIISLQLINLCSPFLWVPCLCLMMFWTLVFKMSYNILTILIMSNYTININRPSWQHSRPMYRDNMTQHSGATSDKTTDWIDLVKWRSEHNLQPYDYYATMPKYRFSALPKTEMSDRVPPSDSSLPQTPVTHPFGGPSLKH